MGMLTARFVMAENMDTGEIGLKMKGRDWFDPTSGEVIAHDILEHQLGDDGSVEHELMALGASIYVRCGRAWYAEKGLFTADPAYQMSGDIGIYQARYMAGQGRDELRDPGRTRPINRSQDGLNGETIDSLLHRCAQRALVTFNEDHDHDILAPQWLQNPERLIGWMRRGYNAASRRWRRMGMMPWETMWLYNEVNRVVKEETRGLDEGDEITVSINPRATKVVVRIEGREEY